MLTNIVHKPSMSDCIYISKGIGILLVVIGHYEVHNIDPDYWLKIRSIIYSFHMPLFILLSGYLFSFSYTHILSFNNYCIFIRKKIHRLAYPYLSISIIILLVKLVAGHFYELKYPIHDNCLSYIFINPVGGFATILWFLYTLFIIFLIFPLLILLLSRCNTSGELSAKPFILLLTTLFLSTGNIYSWWPNVFCLNLVFHYLPVFVVGFIIGNDGLLENINPYVGLLLSLVMFVIIVILFTNEKSLLPTNKLIELFVKYVQNIAGSLAAMFLSILLYNYCFKISNLFKLLGIYSVSIYLLHTIPMGIGQIAFFQVLKIPSTYYLLSAFIVCILGTIVPIFIDKLLIRPNVILSKYILGISK